MSVKELRQRIGEFFLGFSQNWVINLHYFQAFIIASQWIWEGSFLIDHHIF